MPSKGASVPGATDEAKDEPEAFSLAVLVCLDCCDLSTTITSALVLRMLAADLIRMASAAILIARAPSESAGRMGYCSGSKALWLLLRRLLAGWTGTLRRRVQEWVSNG